MTKRNSLIHHQQYRRDSTDLSVAETHPPAGTWEYFRALDLRYVLIASIVYLSAYFVRSLRWNLLLAQNVKYPWAELDVRDGR